MNQFNDNIQNYASFLSKLSGNEFALIAAFSGYFLSQGLTANQLNSLGNFLEAVGQIMLCKGAQDQYLQSLNNNNQ